jgi:Family of unknown function (DUF6521)
MASTRWTLAWAERPPEEAALFNPAYCGELIARTVTEYEALRAAPLPFALAFVVLPLTLHAQTRSALPGRANTTFATWAAARSSILVELPGRILALRPVTREALLFLTQHGAVAIVPGGLIKGSRPLKLTAKRPTTSVDAETARRAAGLVGRWFANQGATALVLQSLGVRP